MIEKGEAILSLINEGDIQVELPTDVDGDDTMQTPGSFTLVTSTTRVATRAMTAGL
jgi:hypothetical protein